MSNLFPVEIGLDWTILSRYTVTTVQTAQSTHTSNNYLDHSRTIKNSNQKPRTKLSVLLLLLLRDCCLRRFFHTKIFEGAYVLSEHLPVFLLGTELCLSLKIFACLSKHLPVFLLGTENVVGGGWMAILVVVCGKICGKMCGKIEKLAGGPKGPQALRRS